MEQVEKMKMKKSSLGPAATPGSQGPSTSSKYEGLTAALAAELMIDFWFGIGAILAIKMVNSLEELISRK